MYSISGWLEYVRVRPRPVASSPSAAIPRNVIFLGLTSLLTDISSEMVVSILPIYLVGFLGLSLVQFGIVDGLYQGVAGVTQLGSALLTDRWRRYREMAAVGYVASTLCRAGLLLTTTWTGITALLTLDRLGKGVRTAPRDALISLSVPRERLGFAFGVHRAMDAVGAMLGPVVAFAILGSIQNGFDVVFVASLCLSIVGVAVLGFFVENRRADRDAVPAEEKVTAVAAFSLLTQPGFRHLAMAALLFGGLTISDGFIYLSLQRQAHIPAGAFPLLYVMTSAAYLIFAIPVGRIADRAGRFPVFVAGHALLLAMYAGLIGLDGSWALVVTTLVLLGLYYAATEGILMALGSSLLPEPLRTSGLAILMTALAMARILGSAVFGLSWSRFGLQLTVAGYMLGLAAAIAIVVVSRPAREVL
jgi:MFS family permease